MPFKNILLIKIVQSGRLILIDRMNRRSIWIISIHIGAIARIKCKRGRLTIQRKFIMIKIIYKRENINIFLRKIGILRLMRSQEVRISMNLFIRKLLLKNSQDFGLFSRFLQTQRSSRNSTKMRIVFNKTASDINYKSKCQSSLKIKRIILNSCWQTA